MAVPGKTNPVDGERLIAGGFDVWVFDLDNTLYAHNHNLFSQVEKNMTRFIEQLLSLGRDQAYALQKDYFKRFGTTMRGLMDHHGVDPVDFMAFVHDVDLSGLPDNPELGQALKALPGRKVIFTNASAEHADNILAKLGIAEYFDGVFDIIDAGYRPKPELQVYRQMLDHFSIDPGRAIMVEDMVRNLAPAASLGMATAWIENETPWGRQGLGETRLDYVIDDITSWLQQITLVDPC